MLNADKTTTTDAAFLTVEQFEQVLQEEFQHFRLRLPQNVGAMHYSDLNYSARLKAVLRVTRDRGYSLGLEEFNNIVVGRMITNAVPAYINKCVQAIVQRKKDENHDRTTSQLHP